MNASHHVAMVAWCPQAPLQQATASFIKSSKTRHLMAKDVRKSLSENELQLSSSVAKGPPSPSCIQL